MIEYRNGILKLNFKSGIPDMLWSVSFFLLMLSVICYGNNVSGTNYFYYFSFFAFVGISVFLMLVRKNGLSQVALPLQSVWYGLFILLAVGSSLWADSFSASFVPLSKMVQILAVTYCLVIYIDDEEKMQRYIRGVMAASLYLILYIFIKTPPENWFSGFLGSVTQFNTNDVGCAVTICVLFSFYEAYIHKKKLCYLLCLLSFFTVILTSSRKGLLMSALGIILIVTFNYRARNYVLRILCILLIAALAVFLIYQIPILYRTVGVRLDSMIEFMMNDRDRSADYSLYLRRFYIDTAKSYFLERPFFGIGFNNFTYRVLRDGTGYSYAHNNYWEILAGLGIAGFITYYWFYGYLFLKLIRQILNGHKSALLFTSIVLLFIIFEYGIVDYYKMQVHMVLAAAFSAVCINDVTEYQKEVAT